MGLAIECAGKTDVGCVRTNNEDNFGYDVRYGVFIVCDGMGGAAAGEVASKLAVDTVLNYFRGAASSGIYPTIGQPLANVSRRAQAIASAIQLANSGIYETARRHAAQQGMGSTIVVVVVEDSQFSVGHVGDSRVYLIRQGAIQQLTNDHSLVMEQVRRGLISKEEAAHSEMQNIIIRALGSEETVEPDVDDLIALSGDILLLASDGLTKTVSDEKMHEIIEQAASLEQACDRLIQAAKERGGDDNITCLLIKTVRQAWHRKMFKLLSPREGKAKWQNSI